MKFDDLDFSDVQELNFEELESQFYNTFEDTRDLNEIDDLPEDLKQDNDNLDNEDFEENEEDFEDLTGEDAERYLDDYLDELGFEDYEETGK